MSASFFLDHLSRIPNNPALDNHLNNFFIIFNDNPVGMVMSEATTRRYTHVNEMFVSQLGYSREEAIGKSAIELGLIDAENLEILSKLKDQGSIKDIEIQVRRKNGTKIWVVLHSNVVNIDDQSYILTSFYNIDERRITEQKLSEYSRRLEHKNKLLVDFCNIVSHNLRGPLVNISLLTDYLEQSTTQAEKLDAITKLKTTTNILNETFEELVESLQVQQGVQLKSDSLIFSDSLNKALKMFDAQISQGGVVIETDFDAAPLVIFPQKYLDSILSNLISNGLRYRAPGRTPVFKIKTEKRNESIVLSFKDNGLGIDSTKYKDKLFKLRKTFHGNPDAKGFGLFMIRTQIESMGGRIWAESSPNNGATFYVEFNNQKSCTT